MGDRQRGYGQPGRRGQQEDDLYRFDEVENADQQTPPEGMAPLLSLEEQLDEVTRRQAIAEEQADKEYATRPHQERLRHAIESQQLPVRNRLEEVRQMIRASRDRTGTCLLQGETGSGKSIYSPIATLDVLREEGLPPYVVVMQPRRDAASGVATAMAAVTGEELGRGVGFSTSEYRVNRLDTNIKVVTPGIFLRWLMEGSLTKDRVGAIVVDELHENSVDYHLALGFIKKMQEKGEAPLVLLTSATMDKEKVQKYMGIDDEDYLRIEGRTYPVTVGYTTEKSSEGTANEPWRYQSEDEVYLKAVSDKIKDVCASDMDGDVLVFLPGAPEIRDVMDRVGEIPGVEVLPLHGRVHPDERTNALSGEKPKGVNRRVIVATNIAETSVTVPGIKIVIDSCRQRKVWYDQQAGFTRTGTEYVAQDQAAQRTGRAGRVEEGICFRMITQEKFDSLEEHAQAEIHRSDLAHLILRLKSMDIDPATFPFIEPPPAGAMESGTVQLQMLGALDEKGVLTEIGREMGEMVFEPRYGRMMIEAKKRNCIEAALVLAAFTREDKVMLGPTKEEIERAPGGNKKEQLRAARAAVTEQQKLPGSTRGDGNSDWMRNLEIFAAAIDKGLFVAMERGRGNDQEDREVRRGFYEWCRKNHFNAKALTHIAKRVHDYAQNLGKGFRLDRARFLEKLDGPERGGTANDRNLAAVILAGHTDRLLLSDPNTGSYAYTSLQELAQFQSAMYTREIYLRPDSVAFSVEERVPRRGFGGFAASNAWGEDPSETKPKARTKGRPDICIASEIGEGGQQGNRKIYAAGVHPITPELLLEVSPQLFESERQGSAYYDAQKDCVVQQTIFRFKDAPGYKKYEGQEVAQGEEARGALIDALMTGTLRPLFHETNKQTQAALQKLSDRSKGRVHVPSLQEWYLEHMDNAVTNAKELETHADALTMSFDEFCPPALKAELEQQYPDRVQMRGKQYPVRYPPDRESGTRRYFLSYDTRSAAVRDVIIEVQSLDLFALQSSDIPTLGSSSDPIRLVVRIVVKGPSSYEPPVILENKDIESLKREVDALRLKDEFTNVHHRLPYQEIDVAREALSLPTPEGLELTAVAYAKDYLGQPVYAYPAIVEDGSRGAYRVAYFSQEDEAKEMQKRAQRNRPVFLEQLRAQDEVRLDQRDAARIHGEFSQWKHAHPDQRVTDRIPDRPALISVEELGFRPVVYAHGRREQAVLAYPAFFSSSAYVGGRVERQWVVRYYERENEAQRENANAVRTWEQLQQERARERAELARVPQLQERLDALRSAYEMLGRDEDPGLKIGSTYAQQTLRRIDEVARILVVPDSRTGRIDVDSGVSALRSIEEMLEELRELYPKHIAAYERVKRLMDHVHSEAYWRLLPGNRWQFVTDDWSTSFGEKSPQTKAFEQMMKKWDAAKRDFALGEHVSIDSIYYLEQAELRAREIMRYLNMPPVPPPEPTARDVARLAEVLNRSDRSVAQSASRTEKASKQKPEKSVPSPEAKKEKSLEEYRQEFLEELGFAAAFLSAVPKTKSAGDPTDAASLRKEIADVRKEVATSDNIDRSRGKVASVVKSVMSRVKKVEGGATAWTETYKDIVRRRIPAIEAAYGGHLPPDALEAMQNQLIGIARRLAMDANNNTATTLLEELIAGSLVA